MVEVQHGIKIRIYPNQAQREQLDFNFGAVRFLWNKMLGLHEARYKNNPEAKFLSEYDLNNLLPALKLEFPFLKGADQACKSQTRNFRLLIRRSSRRYENLHALSLRNSQSRATQPKVVR